MDNADILGEIFGWIDCGSTYKAVLFTCRRWCSVVQATHPTADEKFANHLTTLLKLYPSADWNIKSLSKNPNITWDFVVANPSIKWNRHGLSRNPSITWGIVQANPDQYWDPENLSRNPNITWDIVAANPGIQWDYYWLSANPGITWNDIQANPSKKWYYYMVSANPNITWDIIRDNPGRGWCLLPSNRNIPFEYVSEQLNSELSPNIPKDFILNGICVNYPVLSYNLSITWDIVESTSIKPWNYRALSENPNITWEIIQSNPGKEWDPSVNPNITWKIVRDNPQIEWVYWKLSENTFGK